MKLKFDISSGFYAFLENGELVSVEFLKDACELRHATTLVSPSPTSPIAEVLQTGRVRAMMTGVENVPYQRILIHYYRNENIWDAESLQLLEQAILVPVAKDRNPLISGIHHALRCDGVQSFPISSWN